MNAKNNFGCSPMLGHEAQDQCCFSLQADLCIIMFFQNTQQSRETEKSVKTNEQSKVMNSYNFMVSS